MDEKERLNPLNDYMFLKIMGEKGDEEQLCAFLNAVLGRSGKDAIVSVEIIENRTINAEVVGDKTSILDVRAIAGEIEKLDVEIQLRNPGNMEKRSLFYWSREFSDGLMAGQDYQETRKVIAINIVNYEFKTEVPDFHLKFHIWEDVPALRAGLRSFGASLRLAIPKLQAICQSEKNGDQLMAGVCVKQAAKRLVANSQVQREALNRDS
jgi:predicted transposase/invertase (TIGR01784 family)